MRVVQLYAGTDPRLNRREYAQQRIYENTLSRIIALVDLEAPTARQALEDLINADTSLTPSDKELLRNNLLGVYRLSVEDAARQIPGLVTSGPDLSFQRQVNGPVVDFMTGYVVQGLEKLTEDTQRQLTQTLRDGYRAGDSIPKLRDRVRAVTDMTKVAATRTARTVTNETFNQAHMETYVDFGVEGVQYVAAKSEGTCDICGALDGTIWPIDSPDIVHPPTHHNCRCRVRAWLKKMPGPRLIDADVTKFYKNFRSKYMPLPILATA